MSSRIEQLIDEIEEYIEGCKPKFMSSTEIIVNKDEIDELLRELRMKTPDEIKRYQKIISNKEAILNDAKAKAEALINEATVHTNELINEHEIMQQAYAQLQKISEAQTDNIAVLLRMADVAYMMEDYIAMTDVCDKALQLDAENVETYFFYARACRGLGDAPRAVSMLTEAIGKREDFYAARLLRGSILLDQAQLSEAELDATFLYEHIPGNEDVLLLKARVEKAQGKMEEAEQTYGKVMDVNPFSIDAYRERSEVRRSLGDSAGAAEDEAAAKEMGAEIPEPSEGIEQKIKEKMQQMDPYKVFHNEY